MGVGSLTAKPKLLYVTPVVPALGGERPRPAMQEHAGMVLEVLAERYEVHLLIVPLYASASLRWFRKAWENFCTAGPPSSGRMKTRCTKWSQGLVEVGRRALRCGARVSPGHGAVCGALPAPLVSSAAPPPGSGRYRIAHAAAAGGTLSPERGCSFG